MKNDLKAEHLSQEVTVVLPLSVVLRISEPSPAITARAKLSTLPSIGAAYQGGLYAGVSVDNEQPVALVLLPGDERLQWDAAGEWAQTQGGVLPSRFDQLVLLKNLKSEFKGEWYWSGEQSAGGGAYAWFQDFGNGGQYGDR